MIKNSLTPQNKQQRRRAIIDMNYIYNNYTPLYCPCGHPKPALFVLNEYAHLFYTCSVDDAAAIFSLKCPVCGEKIGVALTIFDMAS